MELTTNILKYLTLIILLAVLLYAFRRNPLTEETLAKPRAYSELPIYSVDSDKPVLALTFDSAWGTEDLDDILQILDKHKVCATFFVTGQWAKEHPEAVTAIAERGHELGNHGMNHKHMPTLDRTEIQKEIEECHNTVLALTDKEMTVFRAPYSDWSDDVVDVAHSLGYMSVNQSVDSLDWKDYGIDAIIDTVCNHRNLENGSILLLHNGAKYTKDALGPMLSRLEQQGYSFVCVSDLIYRENYYLDHTGKQFQKD